MNLYSLVRHGLKNNIHLLLICLLFSLSFLIVGDSLKIMLVVSVFFFLILFSITKDAFFSLFSLAIIASQFLITGKYYSVEVASSSQYYYEFLPNGVEESYGLLLSDILTIWLFIFLVWSFFRNYILRHNLFLILKNSTFLIAASSWLIFFLIMLIASFSNSFFPELSVTVTLQYSKLLFFFLTTILFSLHCKKIKKNDYLFLIVLSLILFQLLLSSIQFATQIFSNTANQPWPTYYALPEENLFFPRPSGSFAHANDLSFLMFKLLMMVLPFFYIKRSGVLLLLIFWILTAIVILQSRTIWVISFVSILFLYFSKYKMVIFPLISNNLKKIKWSLVLFVIMITLVIIPRLVLSQFLFTKEGGGSLRLQMIKDSFEVILSGPMIGYGAATSVKALFSNAPLGYVSTFPAPPHSAYLWLLIEAGLIGLIFFIFPFYWLLRKSADLLIKRSKKSNFNILAITSTLLTGIPGILVYYLFQPSDGRSDFVFIGFLLGLGTYCLIEETKKGFIK